MILLSLSTKLSMSSWSRQALNRVISEMQVLQDGRLLSRDVLESCLLTLELVCREFVTQSSIGTLSEDEEAAAAYTLNALQVLQSIQEYWDVDVTLHTPLSCPVTRVGRPAFAISTPICC